ncbi:MAG TPA: DUF3052 domain-containing protein [Gemmatimonadaceae bacterium]|jgi:hypothetical protein|nr:DUF3052 domain-containing protein [Gemmatimonadaceae bacterium]
MGSVRRPAGYSGTPLVAKLGIKAGARVRVVNPPAGFAKTLGTLPASVTSTSRGVLDFAMLFVTRKVDLVRRFPGLRDRLTPAGMLWVSWPKQSSGAPTDLTENVVRAVGLGLGLVDVKVCAVDSTWSGLKFVKRLSDR